MMPPFEGMTIRHGQVGVAVTVTVVVGGGDDDDEGSAVARIVVASRRSTARQAWSTADGLTHTYEPKMGVAIIVDPIVLVEQQVDRYGVPHEVDQRVAHRSVRPAGDGRAGSIGNVRYAGCLVGRLEAQAQRGPLSTAFAASPADV
jgi:hypothetical protein